MVKEMKNNGKCLGIMENHSEAESLKKISFRKLKSNQYIIVAQDSAPMVVEECVLKSFLKGDFSLLENTDIHKVFKQNGFLIPKGNEIMDLGPIVEDDTYFGRVIRGILFLLGILSAGIVIVLFYYTGIPTGNVIFPYDVPMWKSFFLIFMFYIPTALLHEFMHMLFGKTFSRKKGNLGINLKKNIVFVSLNHIWTWSLGARIAALAAGIILDVFLLMILLYLQVLINHWVFMSAASLLLYRIIWQFQFYKNCDGRLLAMNILDNPFIHIDVRNKKIENSREIIIWKKLINVGYCVKGILILFWGAPVVISVIIHIKNFL